MEETLKKILSELELIRKIKMIELMQQGYSQSKMGSVLGISQSTISRMMANKKPTNTKATQMSENDE